MITCNRITYSQEAAAQHWCDNGVDEGRQATSSFHTKQYLDNYPDLAEVRYHEYLHMFGKQGCMIGLLGVWI